MRTSEADVIALVNAFRTLDTGLFEKIFAESETPPVELAKELCAILAGCVVAFSENRGSDPDRFLDEMFARAMES